MAFLLIENFVTIEYSGGKKLKIAVEFPFSFFDGVISHSLQTESQAAF
jgi:hypothetical protein